MSHGPNVNTENLMLKMKKRTQEFLNAANIAAAKSMNGHQYQDKSHYTGNGSIGGYFSEMSHNQDVDNSKSDVNSHK